MKLPVETSRSEARGVATLIAHKGADIPTQLQRLRSWILTRGVQPTGRGSWTITGTDDFQVRHDIDRNDIETETVPQGASLAPGYPVTLRSPCRDTPGTRQ